MDIHHDPDSLNALRRRIRTFLDFHIPESALDFSVDETVRKSRYTRSRIRFTGAEGDPIHAFLLIPDGSGPFPAVLVHHQHHGQRHLGKSEVCGLAGDPLQAFGPALARKRFLVLAPDSICFEDRRANRSGIEPAEGDVAQHYNEMAYALLRGDTLMRRVLADSALGISLLHGHPQADGDRIGILGHSYGGSTALFHGALDERIRFACASGAAGSYHHRMANDVGIELSQVIPSFPRHFDTPDLLACFTPRPVLVVSAEEDPFSADADEVVRRAGTTAADSGVGARIEHHRYPGGHGLTQERFDKILGWVSGVC